MIDILEIQNFQGHKDTGLSFSPGINIITGLSYTGKTSIIRALRWLVNNKPIGNNYRSRWGDATGVCIYFDNNFITRFKNEKENGYSINGKVLKAIGGDVPNEVKEKLNISDINIQYQLDSPFFISETTGEMARYLNRIVDLEKIDTSLSKAEQDKRKVKSEIDFIQQQIEKLEAQKMQYEFLNEMEKDVKELNSYMKIIIEYGDIRKKLFELVKQYNTITRKIEDHKEYKFDIREVISIEKLYKEMESNRQERTDLHALLFKIQNIEMVINKNTEEVISLKESFEKLMPDICPLCGNNINENNCCHNVGESYE